MEAIRILVDGVQMKAVNALLGAPVEAMKQQGLIQMWSVSSGQQGKYILHALAQRALIELEDKTIEINQYPENTILEAIYKDMTLSITGGALLTMDADNQIQVFVQEGIKVASMLREFHRYAARMIRLDL